MSEKILGVFGGSGVYDIEGFTNKEWLSVESPWGTPSDQVLVGDLEGTKTVFMPRHGRGHKTSPSDINYRANIDVMKRMGVTDILSVSACGSLKKDLPPGHFVIVDQFIDRSFARNKSFFGDGLVAHVSMAHPTSPWLGDIAEAGCSDIKIPTQRGGTYLVMEGPQFSTLAESNLYRQWGCDVIGMTNMPEAKLAREAEMRYATVAMVTDFDCWHPDHDDVDVVMVIETLMANADKARALVKFVAANINNQTSEPTCGTDTCLDMALITAPDARNPALTSKLDAIAGRIFSK